MAVSRHVPLGQLFDLVTFDDHHQGLTCSLCVANGMLNKWRVIEITVELCKMIKRKSCSLKDGMDVCEILLVDKYVINT